MTVAGNLLYRQRINALYLLALGTAEERAPRRNNRDLSRGRTVTQQVQRRS